MYYTYYYFFWCFDYIFRFYLYLLIDIIIYWFIFIYSNSPSARVSWWRSRTILSMTFLSGLVADSRFWTRFWWATTAICKWWWVRRRGSFCCTPPARRRAPSWKRRSAWVSPERNTSGSPRRVSSAVAAKRRPNSPSECSVFSPFYMLSRPIFFFFFFLVRKCQFFVRILVFQVEIWFLTSLSCVVGSTFFKRLVFRVQNLSKFSF